MCNFYIAPFHTKCSERFTQLLPRQACAIQHHLNFLGSIRMSQEPKGRVHSTIWQDLSSAYGRVPILNTAGWTGVSRVKHLSQGWKELAGGRVEPTTFWSVGRRAIPTASLLQTVLLDKVNKTKKQIFQEWRQIYENCLIRARVCQNIVVFNLIYLKPFVLVSTRTVKYEMKKYNQYCITQSLFIQLSCKQII